mgnify:CR=1 FL=1
MRVISYWKATRVIKHHGFHHQYADTVTSMAQSTLKISDFFSKCRTVTSIQSTQKKPITLAVAQLGDTGVGLGTFVILKGACGKTTTH